MKIRYFSSPTATNTLTTDELREQYLVGGLFRPGELVAEYTDLDRIVVGGAVPTAAPLALPNFKATGNSYFLERREIGILNIGDPGAVLVGGARHEVNHLDCLYVGMGEKDVVFENGPTGQAQYYLVSTPAHAKFPTAIVRYGDAKADPIGDPAKANRRRIRRLIHLEGIRSSQLVMGFTEFEPGSVWNTIPPHVHSRRTEVYLYFDLGDNVVVHLMGEPEKTRHLVVRDREVVLSPSWSIHCGAGTGNYRFVWAMGGDNQVYTDMDPVPLSTLR